MKADKARDTFDVIHNKKYLGHESHLSKHNFEHNFVLRDANCQR